MRQEILWDAGAVVLDTELERKRNARLAAGERQPHPRSECGGEAYFTIPRALANGLGRVLYEIEEDLDELVAIGEHERQRGIVVLDEFYVSCEAGMREP